MSWGAQNASVHHGDCRTDFSHYTRTLAGKASGAQGVA